MQLFVYWKFWLRSRSFFFFCSIFFLHFSPFFVLSGNTVLMRSAAVKIYFFGLNVASFVYIIEDMFRAGNEGIKDTIEISTREYFATICLFYGWT